MNTTPENRFLIVLVVMSAAIMQVLDITIINVALPEMQGDFSAAPDEITWILTSYLVASGITLPLTGYLVEKFGRKNYLIISIFGFTFASALCGIANDLSSMVLYRTLQGIFGASLIPLSQAIMADSYPIQERGKAMAIWAAGVTLGPVLGPTLGGYFTEFLSWRWCFYINIPIGLIAGIIGLYVINNTEKNKHVHMDWSAFILLALGIGALQFTLDRGEHSDWFDSNIIRTSSLIAVFGLISFIVYNIVARRAFFSIKIITNKNFLVANFMNSLFVVGIYGTMLIFPMMLSNIFNYPNFTIGLIMAPRGIASMISMIIVSRIIKIITPRQIVFWGLILNIIGTHFCTYYNTETNIFWLIWPSLLQGLGIGFVIIPLSTLSLSTLPKSKIDEASGIFSLTRTIGGSVGISTVITFFARDIQRSWNSMGEFINQFNPAVSQYLSRFNLSINDPESAFILAKTLYLNAQMQAVINTFYILNFSFIILLPCIFFLKKGSLKGEVIMGH